MSVPVGLVTHCFMQSTMHGACAHLCTSNGCPSLPDLGKCAPPDIVTLQGMQQAPSCTQTVEVSCALTTPFRVAVVGGLPATVVPQACQPATSYAEDKNFTKRLRSECLTWYPFIIVCPPPPSLQLNTAHPLACRTSWAARIWLLRNNAKRTPSQTELLRQQMGVPAECAEELAVTATPELSRSALTVEPALVSLSVMCLFCTFKSLLCAALVAPSSDDKHKGH